MKKWWRGERHWSSKSKRHVGVAVNLRLSWPLELYLDIYKWAVFFNLGPLEVHAYLFWEEEED